MNEALLFLALAPMPPHAGRTLTPAGVHRAAADVRLAAGAPPEPYRSYLAALRGGCWGCREWGTRGLRAASRADLRWAMAGTMDPDLEVRWRCRKVLRTPPGRADCPACGGLPVYGPRGLPRVKVEYDPGIGADVCSACRGEAGVRAWRFAEPLPIAGPDNF